MTLSLACGENSTAPPVADAGSDNTDSGPEASEDAGGSDQPDAGSDLPDAVSADAQPADATEPDAGTPDSGAVVDVGVPDAGFADASPIDASSPDGSYRSSLAVCWTDPSCPRKLAVAHGGQWNTSSAPYDSNAAIEEAYLNGVDGVKIDVRVTADDVPVIAHSSPIEIFESIDCYNDRIEEMTAAEVEACHRFPSSTETFQRLDDVLNYLRGKMVAQLTVKESTDYERTIAEVINLGAQDFAFLEISTSELQNQIPNLAGSDQVYYLINIESNYSEIDVLIDTIQNPRAFMYEMNDSPDIAMYVTNRLHPNGVRAFIYDSASLALPSTFEGYFEGGFDVVSANAVDELLTARMNVNQANGVSPP